MSKGPTMTSSSLDDDYGYQTSPLQLAAIELRHLPEVCERADTVRLKKEVRDTALARRENAAARLAAASPLALPALLPSSKWLADAVYGAVPLNTSIRKLSLQAQRDGLHVLELFGGVGLGVLRTALSARHVIRCYTYVDHDPISRRIAKEVLQHLQQQYPDQLPLSATLAFEKRLPQSVQCISNLLLGNLVTRHGPVDLLGGSWEC